MLFRRTQTWSLHAKFSKFGWHTFANNARMKNSKGLIFGDVVNISIIYHIPDSWLYSVNGFWSHDRWKKRPGYLSLIPMSRLWGIHLWMPFVEGTLFTFSALSTLTFIRRQITRSAKIRSEYDTLLVQKGFTNKAIYPTISEFQSYWCGFDYLGYCFS